MRYTKTFLARLRRDYHLDPENEDRIIGPLGKELFGSVKSCGYARVEFRVNGKRKTIGYARLKFYLKHRYMPQTIEHLDRNKLNNALSNLAAASPSENNHNQGKRVVFNGKPTSSKYKGVTFGEDCLRNPWRAVFREEQLGYFASEVEAAEAYDAAARKSHFAHACTYNFPRLEDGERPAIS